MFQSIKSKAIFTKGLHEPWMNCFFFSTGYAYSSEFFSGRNTYLNFFLDMVWSYAIVFLLTWRMLHLQSCFARNCRSISIENWLTCLDFTSLCNCFFIHLNFKTKKKKKKKPDSVSLLYHTYTVANQPYFFFFFTK